MPSTYTLNNGIELIGTGEQSGTWGDTTNINFQLVDTALDGQVSINLTSTGTSGSPNLLEISDGATSSGRNRLVIFTGTPGAADADVFVRLDPNDAEKIIYVRNDLGGTRVIRLFQGTYSASNDYDVPQGTTAVVFFDGAGTGAVAANVFNNAFFDSLRLGGVSVTAILDEDNMSSDSATALATQQSIKKYVDDKAAAQDTLAEVLANGNTTGGTNIQMTTTDELQFRDTALKISSSADGKLDIDADTEIEIVAPTVDIDASTAMTIDTAALTVTGAVDLNTSLNVDGTVTSDGVTVAGNLSVDGGTIKLDGNYPTGTNNVALGDAAGDALASGGNLNVAVGSNALSALVTGDDNVAVGAYALDNVTGADNVGVGSGSLGNSVNSASQNVGLGSDSLTNLASAAYNTAIGHEAGNVLGDVLVATALVSGVNYTIQTLGTTDFTLIGAGSNSVGVSFTATGAGSGTGTASANANYNTFVGHQAGDVIVGGSKNSILGRFDGNQNTIDIRNSDNNIVLSDGDGNPRLAYVSANTELVINEQSADVDFRVESNNNANAFFVEGPTGHIGMGVLPTTSYGNALQIHDTGTDGANLRLTDSSSGSGTGNGLDIIQISNAAYFINRESGSMFFFTSGAEKMRIESSGNVTINNDSNDSDFTVKTDNSSATLFVHGQYDGVGIHTTSPISYANAQAVLYIEDNANPAIGISDTGQTRDWWIVGLGDGLGIRYADGSNTGSASNLTEAMFFKNTGFVGVGATSSPLSGLHISDGANAGAPQNASRKAQLMIDAGQTASADLQFMVRNGYDSHIFFGDAADPNTGIIHYSHSANHMNFTVNTTTALTIDDQGDVGIGSTDPTSRLVIEKESARTNEAENMIRIVHKTSGTSAVGFGSKILFAGERSNGTLQNQGRIGFVADVNTSSNLSSALILEPSSSGLPFEAMRINSSGNVIIGNSTSTLTTATLGSTNTFLELQGLATSSGTIVLSRDADANDEEIGGIRFANRNNADDTNLDADGKLVAAISVRAITSDNNAGDDSGADLTFSTKPEAGNFAERMRISSNGAATFQQTSTETNTESNIGAYFNFRNLSSAINTGVGITLGSNNNGGTAFVAQRVGANNEHIMKFQVRNSSGSSATRATIDGNGDLTLSDGNLVIGTSGHGIDFSADSHGTGMQSEVLDDYEEGTCTLTWSGTGTAGPTNSNFKYVKVGSLVSINGSTGSTLPTPTGTIGLTGLPFAANGNTVGSILYRNISPPTNQVQLVGYLGSTATEIQPYWAGSPNYARLDKSDFNSSVADMYFGLNYRTT